MSGNLYLTDAGTANTPPYQERLTSISHRTPSTDKWDAAPESAEMTPADVSATLLNPHILGGGREHQHKIHQQPTCFQHQPKSPVSVNPGEDTDL